MNLSELATHICEQCGMNDTDDVAAAKMFLQRRLEMIWNTQLWRDSLIEATMNLQTDGTVDLAQTVWVPSRGTLLLPPAFGSVLGVRQSNHTLNVASLESYFRTDADWLNMEGDPTEFQILRPIAWEFDTPTGVRVQPTNTQVMDGLVVEYSTDMVTRSLAYGLNEVEQLAIGYVLQIWSITKPTTVQTVNIDREVITTTEDTNKLVVTTAGLSQFNGTYTGDGLNYVNDANPSILIFLSAPNMWVAFDSGTQYRCVGSVPTGTWFLENGDAPAPTVVYGTSTITTYVNIGSMTESDHLWPKRQRLRLSARPQLELPLRVLGKAHCPVLGDYDEPPINNVEPCLLAFARGDMLMRQRQHGKAQLAQVEGTALLKQLAASEAHQQANHHCIQPASGFGEYPFTHYPSHSSPL